MIKSIWICVYTHYLVFSVILPFFTAFPQILKKMEILQVTANISPYYVLVSSLFRTARCITTQSWCASPHRWPIPIWDFPRPAQARTRSASTWTTWTLWLWWTRRSATTPTPCSSRWVPLESSSSNPHHHSFSRSEVLFALYFPEQCRLFYYSSDLFVFTMDTMLPL